MFAEDMAIYFDPQAGFATPVSFDGGQPINCLYDNAYLDVQGAAATTPVLTVPTALVGAVVQGSTALVDGATLYRVVSIEPDGTGITSIQLRK